MTQESKETILEVKNLTIHYITEDGVVKAVNDISFYLNESETLGLAGETGAGKTTTALGLMGLIPEPTWESDWRADIIPMAKIY